MNERIEESASICHVREYASMCAWEYLSMQVNTKSECESVCVYMQVYECENFDGVLNYVMVRVCKRTIYVC